MQTTTTDASGRYTLANVPPGSTTVTASLGLTRASATLTVNAAQTALLPLTLIPSPGTVQGIVSNAQGTPLAGAQVIATQQGSTVQTTTTDASGRYTLANVPPGSTTVTASLGLVGARTTLTVNAAQTLSLPLRLIPSPGTVQGTVTDAQGTPLAGALVVVTQPGGTSRQTTTTDASGRFTFTNVSSGPTTATVSFGFTGVSTTLTVNAFQTSSLPSLVLAPRPQLFGVGTPSTTPNSPEVFRYDGQTGTFLDVFVSAINTEHNVTDLALGPDGNLYVSLGGTTLIGTGSTTKQVLRYDGRTGAFLDVFIPSGRGGLDTPTKLVFGPDGNLYVISFSTPPTTIGVLRYDGQTGAFLDVFAPFVFPSPSFPPPNLTSVQGTVTDAQGAPLAGAQVVATQQSFTVQTATTNASGQYTLFNVPAGATTITASLGTVRASTTLTVTGSTLPVSISAPPLSLTQTVTTGTVQGTVTDAQGAPLGFAQVVATQQGITVQGTRTDTNGQYTLFNVPPGPTTVTATAFDRSGARATLTVSATQTASLPLRLGPPVFDPTGLVFGPDGNLYVSSRFSPNGVLRYDGQTGAFVDVFVPSASGGLGSPTGLVFGPDGNLYVSSNTPNGVLRYDGQTGAFVDVFVPSARGGLGFPRKLVFGPDDNLYVSDSSQVLRYDGQTGAFVDVFVPLTSGGISDIRGFVFLTP